MTRWRSVAATLLGAVLVLHGLANAVLPLRGVDAAEPGVWIPAIVLLCVLAIVGFVAAGLGVAGVRPLDLISMPAVWAAALNFTAFELPRFIMQRRMLLGIKALAEQAAT